jgi:hypothetical protein
VNPDSLQQADLKAQHEESPVQAGRGMSNFNSNWKIQDPILKIVANREQTSGDRIEFRNRGTKVKYRHTFEPDGSLRKPHKLNFPHFVLIRNYTKNPNKSWNRKESKNC